MQCGSRLRGIILQPVRRRELVRGAAGASVAIWFGAGSRPARADDPAPDPARESSHDDPRPRPGAFDGASVRRLAQAMARRPYRAPDPRLPKPIDHLDFDQYRSIRFLKQRALWHGLELGFEVEFLPRGFLYRPRIDMFEVAAGQARRVGYDPDLFGYADPALRVEGDLGFAGFRIHAPLNRPDYLDEVCVFQGASYFRAVARGQEYGLSARGFASGTGSARGEEFPLFSAFWLERPQPGGVIVVHALLDSPSVTGAFRFTIRPGEMTVFDVESVLYPRRDLAEAGVAPLTGMFYFDANDRSRVDDWRPAAHDSEGLSVWNGHGEQLWRPLVNPAQLQFSALGDSGTHGFGLMQRKRAFDDFQDLALNYQKRPSLWIEPIGDWGEGAVDLVELPTPNEVNDNIVGFWRPRQPLRAGGEYAFTYRMHWGWDNPFATALARVAQTRIGGADDHRGRIVAIDFTGEAVRTLPPEAKLHADVGASSGAVRDVVVEPNPEIHGWRIIFRFDPGGAAAAELHCTLASEAATLSETWLYRWSR